MSNLILPIAATVTVISFVICGIFHASGVYPWSPRWVRVTEGLTALVFPVAIVITAIAAIWTYLI